MAKFTWLQDLDFIIEGGGAQNTDRMHFFEGIRRGYESFIVTPQGDINAILVDNEPLIISNASMFSIEVFQHLMKRDKPCVWFFHDYWPIARWRLYYPMLEKCKTCYRREVWLPILMKAKLMIWLSPLHRKSWLWTCPELEERPYAIVPSPVDPKQFHDLSNKRKGVISVNSLLSFKGRDNVLKWAKEHPEERIDFIGGNEHPDIPLPSNCQDLGLWSFWTLNELYNKYETLLHLPGTPQPFERTVPEAYLAGCNIWANRLVGALSYDWFKSREEVVEHCSNAPKLFWEEIERVF
ncbi:MAG: hypothetical protein KKB37_17180 [Alphaproteobacteria bacterium]|nr:hypothetical protein [Alphaproteobacteria bacterium]